MLGLPGGPVHLEIVRLRDAPYPASGLDQLVFYLPDTVAQERMMARLAAAGVGPASRPRLVTGAPEGPLDWFSRSGGAEGFVCRLPPKNSRPRSWTAVVLGAGPAVISTVAGSSGTAVLTEPRVAAYASPHFNLCTEKPAESQQLTLVVSV